MDRLEFWVDYKQGFEVAAVGVLVDAAEVESFAATCPNA